MVYLFVGLIDYMCDVYFNCTNNYICIPLRSIMKGYDKIFLKFDSTSCQLYPRLDYFYITVKTAKLLIHFLSKALKTYGIELWALNELLSNTFSPRIFESIWIALTFLFLINLKWHVESAKDIFTFTCTFNVF